MSAAGEAGRRGARAAVLPPVPALLPERAGLADPLPELRAACDGAVRELVAGAGTVCVLHDPLEPAARARGVTEAVGARVARALLASVGWGGDTVARTPGEELGDAPLLVMASGSARRGERAPGHLDDRAFAFDDAVAAALAAGSPAALRSLDAALGDELLAAGVRCLHRLGDWLAAGEGGATTGARPTAATGPADGRIRWAGDPYGVQYWVAVFGRDRAPG